MLVISPAGAQVFSDIGRPPLRPARPIPAMLQAAGLGQAQLGMAVLDPATGALLDGWSEDLPMPPASTLKIMTALYALDRLGPSHRFATRVLRRGDMLVLAGGGDPVLDTDALAVLARMTAAAAGDWRPAGFAVWGEALPRMERIAPEQAAQLAYNPALSGIMLNHNRVHLGWRCEDSCSLDLTARGNRHAPRAFTIRAGMVGGNGFGHAIEDGHEVWTIPRSRLGRTGTRWLPVRAPELYAGDVFQTLCRAEGLVLPAPEILPGPPEGDEITRIDSPPLREVLRGMLEYSTNLTAEAVGLAASGAADLRGSAIATGAGTAVLHDHSGLGADSRISALTLARLLCDPNRAAILRPLLNRNPLTQTLEERAQGDGRGGHPLVQAKTGTLNFVSNLSGYARFPDSVERAFAIMIGDADRSAASRGNELPVGVPGWTDRARLLQRDLIARAGRMPQTPPVPMPEI
ncbi:MAG TPA: D-alanyl-D-alanine carboxypeptidase [Paracoccus sp. (in: a-proteobacteria)]|nr:D-alanyl-D-alanine carboxypeptidase [Paracoccus sp. (in: a-proteobacteria)]